MNQSKQFTSKLFARFLVPALISSLALALSSVTDSLYVGSALGEDGLFIIGATDPLYTIFTLITIGIATGGAVHFSMALGEGREKDARRIFFSAILFDLILILLLMAIGFLLRNPLISLFGAPKSGALADTMRTYITRLFMCAPVIFLRVPLYYFVYADGNPKLASAALVAGSFCDMLFGYIFIVVCGMGVYGSVYTTALGAAVTGGVCLVHFVRGNGALGFKSSGTPSVKLALKSLYTGLSTTATYLYAFLTVIIFNRILLNIGGLWAVAAFDVVYNAGRFVIAVTEGVSMAMIALISTFYSEHNKDGIKSSMRLSVITALGFTVLLAVIMISVARPYCKLFGISDANNGDAVYAMRLYMGSLVLNCLNTVIVSYFQSVEAERLSYLVTGLNSAVLLIPFGGLLSLGGYDVFWLCFLCAEGCTLVPAVILLFRRRLWKGDNSKVFSEFVEGRSENISGMCERIQQFLDENGEDAKRSYFVSLVADELLSIINAHNDNLFFQLTLILKEQECIFHIRDNSRKFNPFELSEEDEIGLRVVKNKAKDFYCRRQEGFNIVTVTI